MELANMPLWVQSKPEKFIPRIQLEMELVRENFPTFSFYQEGDLFYVEGYLITRNHNLYTVQVFYPHNYPYSPPTPVILDPDVVAYCLTHSAHNSHHFGKGPKGGAMLCVIKPADEIGCGWTPDMSVVTIINLAAAWLHAHEVQKVTGEWILPEA